MAQRSATARAIAAGVTGRQLRVLLAVFAFTTTYSRLSDHVSLDQLGKVAGFTIDDAGRLTPSSRRHLRRELVDLAEIDCVTYEPGGSDGRGHASKIGVPVGFEQLEIEYPQALSEGGPRRAPHEQEGGPRAGQKGGPGEVRRGAQESPPPEKYSEEVSENAREPADPEGSTGDGSRVAEEAIADIRRRLPRRGRRITTHDLEHTG
jgi:hypothetical protein